MPEPSMEDYGIPGHAVVVVTGPRHIADSDTFTPLIRKSFLEELLLRGEFTLVHGDAIGVDRLCAKVANELDLQSISVPYFGWLRGGGGPARNAFMLDVYQPRIVHGFHLTRYHDLPQPGSGTANCVKQAIDRQLPVMFHTPSAVEFFTSDQGTLL